MFAAPQDIALRIHLSLGVGRGADVSLKYRWCLSAHIQDDGSTSYCLHPNDYRITGRTSWLFPKWWRRSMNNELIRLARVIQTQEEKR
jgi:hypothetical protein